MMVNRVLDGPWGGLIFAGVLVAAYFGLVYLGLWVYAEIAPFLPLTKREGVVIMIAVLLGSFTARRR